jgi:hypothetical protein
MRILLIPMNIVVTVFELSQLRGSSHTPSVDKDVKDFEQMETMKTTQFRYFL